MGDSVGRHEVQAMSDFEFTSVVVSILIAFAFSEILASWGRIIKRWPLVKFSGLYFATSAILLLALAGHWLGMSGYRDLPAISPAESLLGHTFKNKQLIITRTGGIQAGKRKLRAHGRKLGMGPGHEIVRQLCAGAAVVKNLDAIACSGRVCSRINDHDKAVIGVH